ncbi:MAG: AAA family ATPase [Lachnospiraceae bacterium]|nr:AAA family ATPase [Lachnospiraceae bacterium]
MKIKSLKYGNFRNFEKNGEITFATDGKITIIYGTNGDGKTTLHQLFQWILYGQVNFNKTTSADKLYNLARGQKLSIESSMPVWGQIEFEHNSDNYIVRREWEYYKQRNGEIYHKSSRDEFFVQKQMGQRDWKELERPNAIIDEVLPYGLAPYFFFDGETMIADLKIRGTDSAKTLKKALHSIFELEVYEKALLDLGNKNKTQSVIGQLEIKRKDAQTKATTVESEKQYITEINILTKRLEEIDDENDKYQREKKEHEDRIKEISEQIGTNKSKKQLEESRSYMQDSIVQYGEDIKREMLDFGNEVSNNYAYLLIAEVVQDARERLYMQVQDEEKKIIPGLSKELLMSLLKNPEYTCCICGHEIGHSEINSLEEWKSYFPPASYKSTYDKFNRHAGKFSGSYDENRLISYFRQILEKKDRITKAEEQIKSIDEQLSGADNIDKLIDERRDLEEQVKSLSEKISKNENQKGEFLRQKNIRDKRVKNIGHANSEVQKYDSKIEMMEAASEAINNMLQSETCEYSKMLQSEIQSLINSMLTSKREVSLSDDFQLQVKDSYGDESKSEGQFAVISFAYIGGILKVLKSYDKLADKEYPLILDGPFSKLDEEQKRNVVSIIPQYAPQVIIFSKDPLNDYVENTVVGKEWTIVSNEEKNNAEVREGLLWK